MGETYNNDLCKERCKTVNEKLADHEQRLNGHSARLDKLEQSDVENRTEIKNLCKQISNLVSTIKWGLGIFVTVSIFILGYLIQRGR